MSIKMSVVMLIIRSGTIPETLSSYNVEANVEANVWDNVSNNVERNAMADVRFNIIRIKPTSEQIQKALDLL
jgi:hypothetical protein